MKNAKCKLSTLTIITLGALLAFGCARRDEGSASPRQDREPLGHLPGLRSVPSARLRDELARITEEGGAPEQLEGTGALAEANPAVALRGLFPPKKLASLLETSAKIWPPRAFQFDPLRLQKAIDFRKKYEAERVKAHAVLSRPECKVGIQFTLGFHADLTFVDAARLCGRLEGFQAAEALADERPAEAIEPLAMMLRLASRLAAAKHPVPRLEAAYLRSEAFSVVQAIVNHEKITRKDLDRLYDLVSNELASWPNDADAWIGDRSLGLCAYEMVRRGEVLNLLSDKELERFHKEGSLDQLGEAARRSADADETYYMETMRKIIDSCAQPFYARLAILDAIDRDLQHRRDTGEFPLVAGRLLLPGIRKGHSVQARDRANWEAWALALAAATGRKLPPYKTNPLTGNDYQQVREGSRITITKIAADEANDWPVVVPLLAAVQ